MIDSTYVVCGQHYSNKLEAYREALPKGHWPHWNFYESLFSGIDWTREPQENLQTLYRKRAQTIRDRYDTVIVWLSGGADSDNIVHSFLSHGIHIDEIWHRNTHRHHNRRDRGTDPANHCNELTLAFKPRIQEYQTRYPEMRAKIHTFDVMDVAMPFWAQGARDPYTISTYSALLPAKEHKEICSSTSLRGKVCHVYGIDKPMVSLADDGWYLSFQDSMVNGHNVPAKTSDYHEEFFYWHPQSVDIISKQAHIIRRWFERHPDLQWVVRDGTPRSRTNYQEIIKNLIYPWWDSHVWQPAKYDSDIDLQEIFWFYANLDNPAVSGWYDTATSLKREILSIYSHVDAKDHNFQDVRGWINLPANYSRRYKIAEKLQ